MNTLYWDDIDFDLIVPGMITRGPATVSMAEYLNVFRETVIHRLKFFDFSLIDVEDRNLAEFISDEIRNRFAYDKDTFSIPFNTRFRYLITYTRQIITERTFYDAGVLFDVANPDQYELPSSTDPEFLNLLEVDQETVDSFNATTATTPGLNKVFTAKMLRLLYQVLSTYTVAKKTVNESLFNPTPDPYIVPDSVTRDIREWYSGGGSGSASGDSPGAANDDAYNDYTSEPLERVTGRRGLPKRRISSLGAITSFIDGGSPVTNAGYGTTEGCSFVWSYKNKDDIFVDVDFAVAGIVNENYERINGTVSSGRYTNDLPRVTPDDNAVDADIDFMRAPSVLTIDGIRTTYSTSAQDPTTYTPKVTLVKDSRVDLQLAYSGECYANSNSFGFDFFVEPDLWPPI